MPTELLPPILLDCKSQPVIWTTDTSRSVGFLHAHLTACSGLKLTAWFLQAAKYFLPTWILISSGYSAQQFAWEASGTETLINLVKVRHCVGIYLQMKIAYRTGLDPSFIFALLSVQRNGYWWVGGWIHCSELTPWCESQTSYAILTVTIRRKPFRLYFWG